MIDSTVLIQKKLRAISLLREHRAVLVALSGGVDSAALLAIACEALGSDNVLAVTGRSASVTDEEIEDARRVARQLSVRHEVVDTLELERAEYRANAGDRCFHCRSELFEVLSRTAGQRGIDAIAYGAIVDDLGEDRPGMEAARKMAGHVPAALEDELGKLTAPKVTWQDIIRTRLLKARAGNGRNDWTRFRTRPMFTGLLVPKRKSYYAHFGCLLDTSGSMGKEDMAFGLSQLASLDERSEGTIVPADAQIYWDKVTKVKKANFEELSKVKVFGRGGTKFSEFFSDYEQNIGKCDFLIVITDGFLIDSDVAEMKNPGVDVIWLITSGSLFNPPFGRAFDLRST